MGSVEEKERGRKAGGVESLMSARQARRLVDAISAAKAKLDDAGEGLLASDVVPEMKSSDRQRLHTRRTLTVPMWILIIFTALQALFVFTSPLHLGRYSGVHSRAEIILGVSYITLGISVVALCVWIVARNSLLRRSQS
ncbi:MAG: hypothetical protein ACYTBS_12300 [Planctomycetota bacterium]